MNKNRLHNIGSGIAAKQQRLQRKAGSCFYKTKTDAGSFLKMEDYK